MKTTQQNISSSVTPPADFLFFLSGKKGVAIGREIVGEFLNVIGYYLDSNSEWQVTQPVVSGSLDDYYFSRITCDSAVSKCVVVGSHTDVPSRGGSGGFVFYTQDGGVSWLNGFAFFDVFICYDTTPRSHFHLVSCDRLINHCILIGRCSALSPDEYRFISYAGISNNSGVTWNAPAIQMDIPTKSFEITNLTCDSSVQECIATGTDTFTTHDGGNTWEIQPKGLNLIDSNVSYNQTSLLSRELSDTDILALSKKKSSTSDICSTAISSCIQGALRGGAAVINNHCLQEGISYSKARAISESFYVVANFVISFGAYYYESFDLRSSFLNAAKNTAINTVFFNAVDKVLDYGADKLFSEKGLEPKTKSMVRTGKNLLTFGLFAAKQGISAAVTSLSVGTATQALVEKVCYTIQGRK